MAGAAAGRAWPAGGGVARQRGGRA